MAADSRLAFHQVHVLAGIGDGQGCMYAGDSSANHQHVGIDLDLTFFQRLMQAYAADGGADQVLRFSRRFRFVGVHPRDVLANVDHLQQERVDPRPRQGPPERRLMHQRRARCHHNPVKLMFAYVLPDQFLARIRTHVLVFTGNCHVGQASRIFRQRVYVHDARRYWFRSDKRRHRFWAQYLNCGHQA